MILDLDNLSRQVDEYSPIPGTNQMRWRVYAKFIRQTFALQDAICLSG